MLPSFPLACNIPGKAMRISLHPPLPCTRCKVIGCDVHLLLPIFQLQAVLLVQKLYKTLKTASSMLPFARYTLQMLKILCFELVLWTHLSTTPRYLATCKHKMSDDSFLGFTVQCLLVRRQFPRVYCTVFARETTVS